MPPSDSQGHLSVGSGVPFATLSWPARQFCLCGWCGSAETRCIYEDASSLYSDWETTYYTSWEYECLHCGLFTHARNGTT